MSTNSFDIKNKNEKKKKAKMFLQMLLDYKLNGYAERKQREKKNYK